MWQQEGAKVAASVALVWQQHMFSGHGTPQKRNRFHAIIPPQQYMTPPKTNMEPENGSLKQEIPIGKHHFQVLR